MTDRNRRTPSRPPTLPLAYLAVASSLAVLIATLPRTGNQPPPPTVAEFAPQAAREIRQSQPEQSSGSGDGDGACAAGQSCENKPTPKPSEIEVPLVKQCFGDPPRQTEDPQSPPCIPYFKGKNGGATWQGVTENEIRIALPAVPFEDALEVRRLVDHFNKRYQFYGRKITLYIFNARGGLNAQPDPQLELADAKDVDERYEAFASLSTGGRFGSEHLFYDELARRQIISIAHRAGSKTDEAYLRKFAPYRWTVLPGIDRMQRHVAESVCKVLAGKPASYAGPGSQAETRRFGLIYGRAGDGTVPKLDLLRADLERCRVTLAADVENVESDSDRNSTNTMLKMREAGVSSVICFCDNSETRGGLMQAASAEQYRPEWIVSSFIDNDVDNSFSSALPDQATHVLGVSFRNRTLPRQDMAWYWAMKDAHPDYDPPDANGYPLASRYSALLLLASGIQMAGPVLTPQTFEQGLFRARFPNPGAGGPPFYQARIGFEGGRHAFISDATMYWYGTTERGTVDPASVGAVCYVENGKRYELGRWPRRTPAMFDRCRS